MKAPGLLPTIDEVVEIVGKGPWGTKSGAELNVLFGIALSELNEKFFDYDLQELSKIPQDIRGLRSYSVKNIPLGVVGADEWHKVRQELVFATKGSVEWICEDSLGDQKRVILTGGVGVWIVPFILHTYRALTEGSSLLVVANTLFIPDAPSTHDTYSREMFKALEPQREPL